MKKFFKILIFKLHHLNSKISFDSDVSYDTKLGKKAELLSSTVYGSNIGAGATLDSSSIFSSRIGANSTISKKTKLFSSKISNNVLIGENCLISRTSIGRFSYLAGNNRSFDTRIGAFCSIAENVIIGHAEHPYKHFSTSPLFYSKNNPFNIGKFVIEEIDEFKTTIIGNDVWIGNNAFIKTGVKIGDGCVIGAGTIVTKDVEPYSVVVGVPGKVLKRRFSEEKISKFQSDKWWDMEEDDLIEYINALKKGTLVFT